MADWYHPHGPLVKIIDDVTCGILHMCQLAEGSLKDKIPSAEWKTDYLVNKQSFILLNLTSARQGLMVSRTPTYGIADMQHAVGIAMRLNSVIPLIQNEERQLDKEIDTIAFAIDTIHDCISAQMAETKEYYDRADRIFDRAV